MKLKVFLADHGIPVRVVVHKANKDKDVAFVYLTDAGNVFSLNLILNLNNSLADLAEKIKVHLPYEEQTLRIKQELANLYIRQTDYTIDFLGYFIMLSLYTENSENKFNMLRALGTAIGM
jgi:hypothetical protein